MPATTQKAGFQSSRDSSASSRAPLKAPSLVQLLAEGRGILELGASLALAPALLTAPRGDGHPVLFLPGFLASDYSTLLMRRYLTLLGYKTYGWDLGRNLGGVYGMRQKLRALLAKIHAQHGQKVSIVGWSLGGVYARDLALSMPEQVRYVITMGSPFRGDLTATRARQLYALLSGERIESADPADLLALAGDMPVPTTSIFTRNDGIVHHSLSELVENDRAENIEVPSASHLGLGVNPAVLWAIADRLAQPEGTFARFSRFGVFGPAYAPRKRVE